jgi:hypothetical protein
VQLLGDSAVESQRDSLIAGEAEAFSLKASASGSAGSVHLYIDQHNTARTVIAGIYTNTNGRPGALLSSGSASTAKTSTWLTVPLAQAQLSAGSTYWLAILGEGGTLHYRDRHRGPCPSVTDAQSGLGAMPATWRTGTFYSDCPPSAYITATTSPVSVDPLPPVSPIAPTPPLETTPPPESTPPPATPPSTPPASPPVTSTPPAPPTASFTYSPKSPIVGEELKLDSASSSCPDGPCTYEWSDDGSATPPATTLWPLGHGQILSFTFLEAGTKYVRLTITDAAARTATVEHNVAVSAPLLSAPANTVPPAISGTTTEGQTLSASTGSWSGLPLTYTYQWQGCNSSGEGCSDIAGASTSTYTLSAGQAGETVRVIVTASNLGGSTPATSAASAVIAALPPSPPGNTVMPAVNGTTTQGQKLTASNGTWTGSPTSYGYQWRHCGSSGKTCTNISGATASNYTLAASDVGHTMSVTVTAANAGGSSSMSSPVSPVVSAASVSAPGNTVSPAIGGTTTEGETLTASSGTWTGSPTTISYQWQDCNASGASCTSIAGASSTSHLLSEGDVAHTLRVVVTATNAGGSTSASSAASAVIASGEPTEQASPIDTSLPVINGAVIEGQTLDASAGTWLNDPSAYTYQWQDCNSSGASCTNVSGATKASYSLSANDVGDTMRVVVSASNSGGEASATSTQSAAVTAEVAKQSDCMSAPGACGYPDPNYGNVGPSSACSSLTPSGAITVKTAGAVVQNMNISGQVTIAAKNVTLTNDCISANGNGELGSKAVDLQENASGTQITYSDISGANSTSESVDEALGNNDEDEGTVADHDYIENCGECVHGPWTLTNSYVIVNGTVPNCGSECPDHYEDIYCNSTTFVAEHDVLLNPQGQTATLFCDTNGGEGGPGNDHITLTNSLIAGGGYSIYPQGNSTSVGSSTMNVSNNRFARCLTAEVYEPQSGGTSCKGGADLNGYWPSGGYYGVAAYIYCPPTKGQIWSDNVWDDNEESVGC